MLISGLRKKTDITN